METWVLPRLGALTFSQTDERLVSDVIRRVWDESKDETATHVKPIICEVYGFAAGAGVISSAENYMRGNNTIENLSVIIKRSLPPWWTS